MNNAAPATALQLAHELRRALQSEIDAAEGAAKLLLAKLEREKNDVSARGAWRYPRRILARLARIEQLANELERAAQVLPLNLRPLGLGMWVYQSLEQARGQLAPPLREDLGFTIDLAEKDSRIEGDLALLLPMLRDLLLEAARSAGESGRVRLRGRKQEEAFFHLSLTVQSASGDYKHPWDEAPTRLCLLRTKAILEAHGGTVETGCDEYGRPELRLQLRDGEREGALR